MLTVIGREADWVDPETGEAVAQYAVSVAGEMKVLTIDEIEQELHQMFH